MSAQIVTHLAWQWPLPWNSVEVYVQLVADMHALPSNWKGNCVEVNLIIPHRNNNAFKLMVDVKVSHMHSWSPKDG